MAEERLQKVLARAGIASRRAAEELILNGRVKVDGKLVRELGTRVDPRAVRIDVDGKRLVAEQLVYVILHKPRDVMCTLRDPEGRPTVAELLDRVGVRVVPIGRLDFHTSGALLCTNDGEFADKLAHPRSGIPKEYVAKVRGVLTENNLEKWEQSIEIDGRTTQPAEVRLLRVEGDKTWISIVLKEGRNRQVRRLGEATGFPVLRLARISHAGVTTEGLRPGQWRFLTREELIDLKKAYGVPRSVRSAAAAAQHPPKSPARGERKARIERKPLAERSSRPERSSRSERSSRPERNPRASRGASSVQAERQRPRPARTRAR